MMKQQLVIEKLGGQGMGIAHLNGKVVFVPFAVPGDKLTVRIQAEKKNFYSAMIMEILDPSPYRIQAPCTHFTSCGGCAHQNIAYSAQCEFKTALAREIFRKCPDLAHVLHAIVPGTRIFQYRNKMHLKLGYLQGRLHSGFFRTASHELVAVDHCHLCSAQVNGLMRELTACLNKYLSEKPPDNHSPVFTDLIIRESGLTGELLVTLGSHLQESAALVKLAAALSERFPKVKGFYHQYQPGRAVSTGRSIGKNKRQTAAGPLQPLIHGILHDRLCATDFSISPETFFQINREQTENIITRMKQILPTSSTAAAGLLDAYAGIGTLSLPLAGQFKQVFAVESNPAACRLAKENAAQNGIPQFHITRGDAETVLRQQLSRGSGQDFTRNYPCLILDPPRQGLPAGLVNLLATLPFKKILYLSCNPHTQARDLEGIIAGGIHRITDIIPFDMFPHTYHIETLAVLQANIR